MKPLLLSLAFTLPSSALLATTSLSEPSATNTPQGVTTRTDGRDPAILALLMSQHYRTSVTSLSELLLEASQGVGTSTVLGTQLALLAHDEAMRVGSTTTAMQKIAFRNHLKEFTSGTDSKQLSYLEESVARSEENMTLLSSLISGSTDATSTELSSRASALRDDLTEMHTFIAAHKHISPFFGLFRRE